jgi:NAD(P)-dependent dehydrogenase (short-subunit alcohol dehydrogenase family)
MQLGLENKVALVTGAGQGIGQAIVSALAGEGAIVAANDLTVERTQATVTAAERSGGRAMAAPCDITRYTEVCDMVVRVERELGPVEILVNNAAVLTPKLFADSTPEDWDRDIKVILYGTLNCTHAVLPGMLARSQGKIVNIASDAARVGQERDTFYSAAKAGVIAFSKSLAKEVGPNNINVNTVSPGATDTPMYQTAQREVLAKIGEIKFQDRQRKILQAYPMRRIGVPGDIANAVLFLASDAARHITGQVMSVNGGFCMPD